MAKYFMDCEFLEGTQGKTIFGIKYGQTKPTIDLISIGIVSEDGREYYAISKDFNLKEAWNRYDEVLNKLPAHNTELQSDVLLARHTAGFKKVYWIRENILKPIYDDLCAKRSTYEKTHHWELAEPFSYKSMKYLINRYGKTNKQIAKEIKEFVGYDLPEYHLNGNTPKFYGYFADYDWVAFCWLFGRMMDLPKGFPMYCIDLKQVLDEKVSKLHRNDFFTAFDFMNKDNNDITLEEKLKHIKMHVSYPEQTNEHNALADAKWNRELYKFLESL